MSAKTYTLGPLTEIPPGEGRTFSVAGKTVNVYHDRSGKVYASETHCPHLGGPLCDGLLGGGRIICPLHERTYDLATGEGVNCEENITVYTADVDEDGQVRVEMG